MNAGAEARKVYDIETSPYMPHLSLLYSDISVEDRDMVRNFQAFFLFGSTLSIPPARQSHRPTNACTAKAAATTQCSWRQVSPLNRFQCGERPDTVDKQVHKIRSSLMIQVYADRGQVLQIVVHGGRRAFAMSVLCLNYSQHHVINRRHTDYPVQNLRLWQNAAKMTIVQAIQKCP